VVERERRSGRLRRWSDRRALDAQAEPMRLPEPEEREAYLVLDFALRAGEILLSGGAGAADVTATTMALAGACGLSRVDCDITFTSITLVYVRATDVAPVTSMRLVRRRALDYTRVTEVHNLVDDLVEGRIDPRTAMDRLESIRRARHPYRSWSVTAARAVLAAAVVVLLGGGLFVTPAAFVSTVLVDRVILWLDNRNVPHFYQNAVGGLIATATALALVAADVGVRPGLVVAGGIILLLPGSTLVGAVQDGITGFLVTAAARAFEVALLTAGIVAGVGIGLDVGVRLGISVEIAPSVEFSLTQVPIQVVAAGVAAAAFAAANYAPRRTIPAAGLAGALGWLAFVGTEQLGLSPASGSAAAAVLVGFGSYALAHRQKAPPLIYLAAGIIPLLPGLTIYRGMLRIAESDTIGGLITLGNAVAIGLALASGAILGEFLAQPARRELTRLERRLAGPRLAGPRLPVPLRSLRRERRNERGS
jgi:uncharacterized membrane protein YjjP (DUF1212 family)